MPISDPRWWAPRRFPACFPATVAAVCAGLLLASNAFAASEESGRIPVRRLPNTWTLQASSDSIYFQRGSPVVDDAATETLRRHAIKLRLDPGLYVTLVAHTSDLGSSAFELAKGQERLDIVKKRLEEMGIPSGRIRAENHGGEDYSTLPCLDEQCLRMKERVDVLFLR